jgi:hypothetical protein
MAKTSFTLASLTVYLLWPTALLCDDVQRQPGSTAVIKVSVDELLAAQKKNTVAADQKFGNRQVEVTGVFRSVSRLAADSDGPLEYNVVLAPTERAVNGTVRGIFGRDAAKALADLATGQVVVIGGTCRSNGNIDEPPFRIERCRLIRVLTSPVAGKRRGWEYKLVEVPYKLDGGANAVAALNKRMNELGADGWEYVEQLAAFSRKQGDTGTICLLFKRKK